MNRSNPERHSVSSSTAASVTTAATLTARSFLCSALRPYKIPDMSVPYSAASFSGLHEMYEIGYETAMKEMPAVKEGIAALNGAKAAKKKEKGEGEETE